MAHQELRGHSSYTIRNLKLTEPKVWDFVEWVFSPDCKDENRKERLSLFFLGRLIPAMQLNANANIDVAAQLSDEAKAKLVELLQPSIKVIECPTSQS